MSIKNIIFDFDGTLADTAALIIDTMKETIAELGLPSRSDAECRSTIGRRLEDVPSVLFPDDGKIESKVFASTYRRLYNSKNTENAVHLFPGTLATLAELRNGGFNLAVASSRSHASLDEYMTRFGISQYFDMIVGGNDVGHGKPAPDAVDKICAHLNWIPEETLVVGDAAVDIAMGKAAAARTCGVLYGNGTEAEIENASPDAILSDICVLSELLSQGE